MEWHIQSRDLNVLVQEAVSAVSQIFNEHGIETAVELGTEPCIAEVDGDRIIQVLINLLSNGAKFCDPTHGRVSLKLIAGSDHFRIEVEDNGPGIPSEQLDRVFELGKDLTLESHINVLLPKIGSAIRRTLGWNIVIIDKVNPYPQRYSDDRQIRYVERFPFPNHTF